MTNSETTKKPESTVPDRRDRKFSVSANRGKASHKVRYVEAGGAAVDTDECAFCEAMPDLSDRSEESGKDRSS